MSRLRIQALAAKPRGGIAYAPILGKENVDSRPWARTWKVRAVLAGKKGLIAQRKLENNDSLRLTTSE